MAYRFPPLNALLVFEAAGRHLSFKKAALELNVTPSAVSHRIQMLEGQLGVRLFARARNGLSLSRVGMAYLPRVREALEILSTATEALPGRRPTGRLSVSVAPTFGARWLVPNLPQFGTKHPEIQVSIDTTHRQVDFLHEGVDVAIRMGRGDWPELYSIRLAQEELVPVCAPSLAATIRTPADLGKAALLHVDTVSDDWESWFALAGVPPTQGTRGLRFDTIHMATQAAARGLGIAVGRLPLVADELAAGTLVAVLGRPRRCATGYWFVAGRESMARPEVVAFRNWVRGEFRGQSARA
ncbi:MAG: transcriptional regulator GcvA [Proteobacteria bacterium]|nr:transcriptional regulator GcvA [Pseudomonadota bacterium]